MIAIIRILSEWNNQKKYHRMKPKRIIVIAMDKTHILKLRFVHSDNSKATVTLWRTHIRTTEFLIIGIFAVMPEPMTCWY